MQLKFWQATGGRDKSARTVQYLARFLAYYRYTQGAPKEVVSSYSSVKSSVSQARKSTYRGCCRRRVLTPQSSVWAASSRTCSRRCVR